ncbi:MAG: cobalamin B12-binding domain-containing protein [Deltaproteobacteria bacterium]|nr:cobalamin B12-binding domain-containing protein [Deltaproteobacteria bacterium]
MKILLVNPPNCGRSIPEEEYGIDTIKMIFRGEPLALEVIAGNLDGHAVAIVDLKVAPNVLEKTLDQFGPDLVGFTGVTCEANTVVRLAGEVKRNSDALVVVGGHHASCDPAFFNHDAIDYIVVGLGKLSFRELVDAIADRSVGDGVAGVAKTNPGGKLNYVRRDYSHADIVEDCPPRYDLVATHRDQYVMSGVGGKVGFVASAYGCTHRCIFCSIPNMTHGRYFTHRPAAVLRDMKLLGEVPVVRLVDANTFGDLDNALGLGQCIIESGLKRAIVADVRAETVTRHPDLFKLWKQAGLAAAVIGFEEISDARLAQLNKRSSVAVNIEAMGILKDLGIRVIGDFIVAPEYTEADFDALERFVGSHAIDLPLPSILTPLPGTPLHRAMRHKITITDLDYYTFTNAVCPTRMEPKLFYQAYAGMLKRFLKHISHG